MSYLTPPRPPLRIIKITSDEPSLFITHRDPTKTPKHPRLSLPPPSPYTELSATFSSPSRHPFFKQTTDNTSPNRKRKERSESVVCLSSPLASASKTRSGSRNTGKTARGQTSPSASRQAMDMDDPDDHLPSLHEALHLDGSSSTRHSRTISKDVRDLRETARDWIDADDRMSSRKKEKLNRTARLLELQKRRRRPLISPSTSPSPAPVSPLARMRARGSSTGAVDTSDSITQPTTPYEPQQQQRLAWSTSPALSPIVHTKGPQDQLWTRHETPELPFIEKGEQMLEEFDRTNAGSSRKGKGKATLADLFSGDELEMGEDIAGQALPASRQGMVVDEEEDQMDDEEHQIDDDREEDQINDLADLENQEEDGLDELEGYDWTPEEPGVEDGTDEYDDEWDEALADVDLDSFSPSTSGPSRPKAFGSIDLHAMDLGPDVQEDHPLTQFDLSKHEFFPHEDDIAVSVTMEADEDDLEPGGVISPIVLIRDMEPEYQEFFNEHWRRGADGAKRRFTQPIARAKARGGPTTTTRKKFWPTRGRGRGRGRARGGARRK